MVGPLGLLAGAALMDAVLPRRRSGHILINDFNAQGRLKKYCVKGVKKSGPHFGDQLLYFSSLLKVFFGIIAVLGCLKFISIP